MNFKNMCRNAKMGLEKKSPEILIGIGVIGMTASIIFAVKATPKAMRIIDSMKNDSEQKEVSKVDIVKATWKCYVPCVLTGGVSIACIVGAHSMDTKRSAALATAYTLSKTAFDEYRNKVVETIGEKKATDISDSISKDKIDKNPVSSNQVIVTERGNTLCYDAYSDRYFRSDIEKIKKIEAELKLQTMEEGYVSLNDYYYEVGLKNVKYGDIFGWNIEKAPVSFGYSSQLAEDGQPCLVVNFTVEPKYDFAY